MLKKPVDDIFIFALLDYSVKNKDPLKNFLSPFSMFSFQGTSLIVQANGITLGNLQLFAIYAQKCEIHINFVIG